MKPEYKEVKIRREDSPVPVAPELFIEIVAMTVVVSEWGFALNPVYNVSLHRFSETHNTHKTSNEKATQAGSRRDKWHFLSFFPPLSFTKIRESLALTWQCFENCLILWNKVAQVNRSNIDICNVNTNQWEPPGWYQVFCRSP